MGGSFRKFTPSKINLEASTLIWLDESVNTLQESIDAQQRLKSLIKNLKTFESVESCEGYIKSQSELDRIVLIVSGALGQKIVRQIHQCKQIIAIYVYCGNKQKHEAWTKEFPKVRALAVQLDELINQIRSDQEKQQHEKTNEPLIFTSFNAQADKEKLLVGLNGQFVQAQLFIDCILQIKSTSVDENELVAICQQEYKGDKDQLALVRKFQNEYSRDQALRWYSRDSFLYRMLNTALRAQDIHLLFLFRFLIRDLEKQLKDHRCPSRVTVYRGQSMWNEELANLKQSKGQLISINSFLSTSFDRKIAFNFFRESVGLERVLFEIDADPRVPGVKPFADITSLSCFPKEEEVLFMLGSIFRVVDISHDRNGVWTVELTLCGDRDHDLQSIFNNMKCQDMQGKLDLVKLGDVLQRMGKYDEAGTYYHRCLDELRPDDQQNISACYCALGSLADKKGDYTSSLEWFYRSLEIDMKILNEDDPVIANTLNSIGNVYQANGDHKRASESYNKALTIFQRAFGEDHLKVAMCLNNIGSVHQHQKKYSEALNYYQNALNIRIKKRPANHPDLGDSYNNIGIVYRNLGQSDEALKQYKLALKIYQTSLPPSHPDIAMTLENIGIVYEEKSDWNKAMSYYKDAEAIYHETLPSTHHHVVEIKQSIQRVSSKLK